MTGPYLPLADPAFHEWARNFSTCLTADPSAYGATPADALAVQTAFVAFEAAYTVATHPATRTRPTIAAKDTAKAALVPLLRATAMAIRIRPAVSDELKLGLGLRLPNNSVTPIPAPTTAPVLQLIGLGPQQHVLHYADSASPTRRAKPAGVVALQLFCRLTAPGATGENSGGAAAGALMAGGRAGAADAPLRQLATRLPCVVQFTPADSGQVAHYVARWQTRRGRVGPWSAPLSVMVPG